MKPRKTSLIIERERSIEKQIEPWLRKQGYHMCKIEKADVVVPLLDSKDRIYTIILVDDNPVEGFLSANLKIMRQLGPDVPIVVTTNSNDPAKEKAIRESGAFYYHMKSAGLDELKTAIKCGLDAAVKADHFMPFVVET